MTDREHQIMKKAKAICDEKGFGAWTYSIYKRPQVRKDTGEVIGK